MRTLPSLLVLPLVAALAFGCSDPSRGPKTSPPDISVVRSLHRGELAAVDSYDAALQKFPSLAAVDLARIRADHADSADLLRARVISLGATPDASAGPWGFWSEAVTKAGAAFGEDAGIAALKMGENHGEREYRQALDDKSVDAETKRLIRETLLPRLVEHVTALEKGQKSN